MHTLRTVVDGNLASYAGAGSLRGDVYLRILQLGKVAKEMAVEAQKNDPELYAVLEAYAAGVNAYMRLIEEGKAKPPLEVDLFNLDLAPWTPEDTMKIVRFDGGRIGITDGRKIVDISALCGSAPKRGHREHRSSVVQASVCPKCHDSWKHHDTDQLGSRVCSQKEK